MKIWKKNLMAAAVLVTVCAGIYLNWLYAEDQATADLTDTLDSGKVLSSDMLVMSDISLNDPVDTATDYFAAVRLSRQEARDSVLDDGGYHILGNHNATIGLHLGDVLLIFSHWGTSLTCLSTGQDILLIIVPQIQKKTTIFCEEKEIPKEFPWGCCY